MRQALTVSLCIALAACGESAPEVRPPAGAAAAAGGTATAGGAPAGPIKGADNPEQPVTPVKTPPPATDDCNKVEIEFAPQVPSVFVLVDRSSSMFESSLWMPLKDGVLAVIEQLQREIHFGFSSYTGAQGMQCPQLTTVVPLAEQNYAAIKRAYDAIAKPEFKGETPTSLAIQEVAKTLLNAPKNSPKFIVLVTDGEPDFCDDPNVTCSRDAVVAAAQAAYAQGIGTFIFSVGGQVARAHLGDVANAGTGQPVEDRQMAVKYQCPTSTATYSATSGNAPFFEPDVNDRAALVTALTNTIAGVRSCVFDLQGKLQIKLMLADQGVVEVDGQRVPYGGTDGYRMNSETQLELLGASCMRLKQPETKKVFIDFPCEAVVLL
jgi:von Willebrand factor type A domain